MTEEDRLKVIGHAKDHIAYGWGKHLPVRHDRREWTKEEIDLYNETYDRLSKEAQRDFCGTVKVVRTR